MKIRTLVIAAIAFPAAVGAQDRPKAADPAFGVDKVKHFFMAGFVESMTFAGLQAAGSNRSPAKAAAITAAAVASFGREIHDKKTKGLFSVRDLIWDAIGASAALLVINKTQK